MQYAVNIYKQYFNFASSHFLIFDDGSREPLHGHNYRVKAKGFGLELKESDMLFDFLEFKPIVRKICDSLDHRLLVPEYNNNIKIEFNNKNINLTLKNGDFFSIPENDILILPIHNISAELLAKYIGNRLEEGIFLEYKFKFKKLEVEVEETPGQSAIFTIENSKDS